MPDYKEMYLTMFRASEQTTTIIIAAQQKCEKMYINAEDIELELLPPQDETTEE